MATQNCGLPQCGNKETSSVSVVKLSSSECEVILYRFGVNLEYLFSMHHKDQFVSVLLVAPLTPPPPPLRIAGKSYSQETFQQLFFGFSELLKGKLIIEGRGARSKGGPLLISWESAE